MISLVKWNVIVEDHVVITMTVDLVLVLQVEDLVMIKFIQYPRGEYHLPQSIKITSITFKITLEAGAYDFRHIFFIWPFISSCHNFWAYMCQKIGTYPICCSVQSQGFSSPFAVRTKRKKKKTHSTMVKCACECEYERVLSNCCQVGMIYLNYTFKSK